jgi:hypothetical protein
MTAICEAFSCPRVLDANLIMGPEIYQAERNKGPLQVGVQRPELSKVFEKFATTTEELEEPPFNTAVAAQRPALFRRSFEGI